MKKENLEECKNIINRIDNMKKAVESYRDWKCRGYSPFRLFVRIFLGKRRTSIDVCYSNDYDIGLSQDQQDELVDLLDKWIKKDEERLEIL